MKIIVALALRASGQWSLSLLIYRVIALNCVDDKNALYLRFATYYQFKRIVLFDTLLEISEREKLKTEEDRAAEEVKQRAAAADASEEETAKREEEERQKGCDTPEILAVLAHELGHWSLNHVLKNIVISEIHIFLMFALFG